MSKSDASIQSFGVSGGGDSQATFSISKSSSGSSGRGISWAVTEDIGGSKDTVVNVFGVPGEASKVATELSGYRHGIFRQFTYRLKSKPMPGKRHWQGHNATGKWIKNYETWEMAQEDLMNRQDVYIKMVEEAFPGSELTLREEELTNIDPLSDTITGASSSMLELQESEVSAPYTRVTKGESVDPVNAITMMQTHFAVVDQDERVRSCYINDLRDLAEEEAKMHPAGTVVDLRAGAIEDSSILKAGLQWIVVNPAKDDREKDSILSRHGRQSWTKRNDLLVALRKRYPEALYRMATNIE